MSLRAYQKKRRFDRTSEPAGGPLPRRRGALSFVVQKHDASRLHYDIRLELDGVLKSWAVPKGPSLDPRDRRLAVHVEDHPIEYATFEGVIPEGEYGAGTVIVWDRGTWMPDGDPHEGLRRGSLKFRLDGKKLKGSWALVRMGSNGRSGDKENWLLIKHRDSRSREGAGGKILEDRPESAASGRALDEVARRADRVWRSNRRRESTRGAGLPGRFTPELATLTRTAPEGNDWIHEIKLDGYRLLAFVDRSTARLTSRGGHDWTHRLPGIVKALESLPCKQALVDGELVALDSGGISDFQLLQNALGSGAGEELEYQLFDVVRLDGKDLSQRPLIERKQVLRKLLARARPPLRFVDHVEGKGSKFLKAACRNRLEGIVSKLRDSPYRQGRHRDWLKTKCGLEEELVIAGWTEPAGSRSGFGALILGAQEKGGRLRYAGRVGTGFRAEFLDAFLPRLEALERKEPPFSTPPPRGTRTRVHWVAPEIIVEVRMNGWTRDGLVRQGSFRRLKDESAMEEKPARASSSGAEVAGVAITHADRVLFAGTDVTKLRLAEYLESVADRMLPYVKDRPLSLVRCPRGEGPCFFQKHWTGEVPHGLREVPVKEKKGTSAYVTTRSVEGLVQLAQVGALEIHPWGATFPRLESPDVLIFDLDPGPGVAWKDLREIALRVRMLLSRVELETFLKTSGGKGLHIYVPLSGKTTWEEVKSFAASVAARIARDDPDRTTDRVSKSARSGKVYIDYLRNARGATCVAPYSSRARAGAPVSLPMAWDRLASDPRVDAPTVASVLARLKRERRSPWADYFSVRQSLPRGAAIDR